ncbi:phage/plasmid replication protein, II/X family, partial [Xanthomonas campestris]|uniref:phage/plasmid replication protein, II/X family n=1 Tax=Xanthomonas campestris TaxID=339 RepID=UPI001E3423D4
GRAAVSDWMDVDGVASGVTRELLAERLGAMTMTTARTLPDDVIEMLTAGQHNAYLAWVAGNDLRDTMSRPSFYRLRAKLLPHGVDIATLMPREVSNVVPLFRTLEAVPAPVPEWAVGTLLYFEPPMLRTA